MQFLVLNPTLFFSPNKLTILLEAEDIFVISINFLHVLVKLFLLCLTL